MTTAGLRPRRNRRIGRSDFDFGLDYVNPFAPAGLTFPTTGILDDFNTGASQNLTARTGWGGTLVWAGEPTLVTDSVPTYAVGAAGWFSNWYNLTLSDCEVYVTISVSTGIVDLYSRLTNLNAANLNGYYLNWATTGVWSLRSYSGGSLGAVITSGTQAISNGDSIGMSNIGTTHTVYYKAAAGSWTSMGSGSDATWASGVLGLETNGTPNIDSFGGGDPSAAPAGARSDFVIVRRTWSGR